MDGRIRNTYFKTLQAIFNFMPSSSFLETLKALNQKSLERAARKQRIPLAAISLFSQTLSALLKGGLPLLSSLEALIDQTEDRYLKIILKWVHEKVAAGTSLSEALKIYPRAFPVLLISMVQAGEASGALATMMEKAAQYFENTVKLQKRIKSAMAYPIGVLILAFVLVNALMIFVVPQFSQMFNSFGKALPLPTQILMAASNFVNTYFIQMILGIGISIWGIKKIFTTKKGRKAKHTITRYIPIIGPLSRKINLARFCRTYGTLLTSGVPVLKTLEICNTASDNIFIEEACETIARYAIEGKLLSDAVTHLPYFPPLIRHMAKAGESSGTIDIMLLKTADFYDTEIDATVGALTSLMEPFLISFLGLLVGGIAMAIFMPVFEMSNLAST